MQENIRPVFLLNKTKTFFITEPFHCPFCQSRNLPQYCINADRPSLPFSLEKDPVAYFALKADNFITIKYRFIDRQGKRIETGNPCGMFIFLLKTGNIGGKFRVMQQLLGEIQILGYNGPDR